VSHVLKRALCNL